MKRLCIIIIFSIFFPLTLIAQNNQNSSIVIKTKNSTLDSKVSFEEAQTAAVEEATNPYLKQFLEASVINSKRKQIQKKILKEWPKYISSLTLASHELKNNVHFYEFKIQILENNLKTLLIENGFLADQSQFISILPIIEIIDETEKVSFQWWRHPQTSERKQLIDLSNNTYNDLSREFFRYGLTFINPIKRKDFELLPNSLRTDSFSDEDLIYLSNYLDLQIILKGIIKISQVESSPKTAQFHLDILNPKTKKIILSFDKKLNDTSSWYEKKNIYDFIQEEMKSSANDLASQIFENWQRGTLNSQTYIIEMNGQFNFEEQGKLKQKLTSKLPEIKSLKERSLSNKSLVFEVETHLTSDLLSEKILGIKELKLRKDMTVKDQTRLIFQKEAP